MASDLRAASQLRLHHVGGWALDSLGSRALAWGASVLILTRWMWREQPALPAWHWLTLALLVLSGAAVVVLRGWAARRSYVVFFPGIRPDSPGPAACLPEDKIALRATGRLDIQAGCASLLTCQPTGAATPTRTCGVGHPAPEPFPSSGPFP